ncbi:predicted protein [Botrytis cinerea T4]|uniref:Uncharacterized protein n=1 Tax=Botryotinia fuckeliana (strain T4) TaxID=999810 RepID=G2XUH7_BOTF4|nr:predicted protein [Botrytis cinerea T4]
MVIHNASKSSYIFGSVRGGVYWYEKDTEDLAPTNHVGTLYYIGN